MSKSTFRILFYLRKNYLNKSGKAGIMIRLTVNGDMVQFSSKLDIEPSLWDTKAGKAAGNSVKARQMNSMLEDIRTALSNKDMAADVRIIAATNEDMQSAVAEKRFRQDLYHRIKEYTLNIPPLRECHEDIMPLAEFFRELANEEFGKRVKGFNAEAKKRMLVHPWSGNVRELKGTVRSAVLHTEGDTVTADTLELDETPLAADASLALNDMEKKQIIHALEQARGNRKLAAALLGIGRTTLYNKIKAYGIE